MQWIEALINLSALAGYLGVATWHKGSVEVAQRSEHFEVDQTVRPN